VVVVAIAGQFAATGKNHEIIGAVPLLDDI
jgi:hypothetical protein